VLTSFVLLSRILKAPDAYRYAKVKQDGVVTGAVKNMGFHTSLSDRGPCMDQARQMTGRIGVTFGVFLHLGGNCGIPAPTIADAVALAGLKPGSTANI
jgi:hypothetical protein